MACLSERSGEIIPHAAGLHISPTSSDLRAGGEADSGLFHLTALGGPGFTGEFPEAPGRIGSFLYSIRAVDASPSRNSAVDPVAGEHGFSVIADSAAPNRSSQKP